MTPGERIAELEAEVAELRARLVLTGDALTEAFEAGRDFERGDVRARPERPRHLRPVR